MPTQNLNDAIQGAPLVRRLQAVLLGLTLAAFHAVAFAADADIEIVSVKGDVRVTAAGAESAAKAGSTLDLPSTVRTGRDGATDLRQGDTTIGVGPNTELDFPAPGTPDGPVDRVVQPLGNAFYNVGPRGNRRLRVETPYLVAVIKGTQFNVAVETDSATISLHEGSLEILAPDIGASVMLNAGEIAIRHRGDDAIRVIPMREGGTAASSSKDPDGSGADDPDGPMVVGHDGAGPGGSGPITPIDPVEGKVTLDAEVDAGGARAGVDADVNLGAGAVDASVDAGVNAAVDLGAGTVDAGVDLGADLGAGPVDASVDTGVDAAVDLGAGTVDAGVDLGVDLGAGPIDASVDAGVDAGVDLGAGTVDAGVDLGIDTGLVDTDVGVDAGVDASAGTVDVGVDVLDTGIDIGLGGDSLIDIDLGATPDEDDSGGLLGGILRRIGR